MRQIVTRRKGQKKTRFHNTEIIVEDLGNIQNIRLDQRGLKVHVGFGNCLHSQPRRGESSLYHRIIMSICATSMFSKIVLADFYWMGKRLWCIEAIEAGVRDDEMDQVPVPEAESRSPF